MFDVIPRDFNPTLFKNLNALINYDLAQCAPANLSSVDGYSMLIAWEVLEFLYGINAVPFSRAFVLGF